MCEEERTKRALRPRVVLVESDPSLALIFSLALRRAGFEVAQLPNDKEALRDLKKGGADAIVFDLGLPDPQSDALLSWLHDQEQGGDEVLPAWVAISDLDREETMSQYGPLGNRFLSKPLDPWQLVRMLKELLADKSER